MVSESQIAGKISEDEATLYDRQIRLWGLEAQKRLKKTRLLVIGLQGLSGEAIKNIVLAGLESVVLCDSENATEDDVKANFLIPTTCVGKNRAESSVQRTQVLNPTVKVSSDTRPVSEINEQFIQKFTVVLATNCALNDITKLNELCRKHKIKFYSGHVWGKIGYYFVDLHRHYYVKEVKKTVTINKINDYFLEKSRQQQEVQYDGEKEVDENLPNNHMNHNNHNNVNHVMMKQIKEEKVEYQQNTELFPTLKQALRVNFSSNPYAKQIRRKKLDPTFFAVMALLRFRTVFKRDPAQQSWKEDFGRLLRIRKEIMQVFQVNIDYFPKEYLFNVIGQFSPTCAITGGVLAQEIIHAIGGTEPPHKNFFLFNPIQCGGRVHYIGPAQKENNDS
ncbi:SUMO-activating enzyme subunit 1 [Chrysoperla carnea]|uniref:SUMO-activating enzyme subunit 1 n=1 Tax=Chrysoperla carnea TaxID=189513 RepID=UPI001D07C007|nr:SUMO-activating enzyme subunit 1 [Chrysoperla carnea]